ncbi:hypothetical protein JCM11251_007959 [Rhodosporidiobolus azoricus]
MEAPEEEVEFLTLLPLTQGATVRLSEQAFSYEDAAGAEPGNLLAVSNEFGWVVAAQGAGNGFSLFSLPSLRQTLSTASPHSSPSLSPSASITTPTPVDFLRFGLGETRVLAGLRDGSVLVFGLKELVQGSTTPLATIPSSGTPLRDLLPNPAPTSSQILLLTSTSTLLIADLSSPSSPAKSLPTPAPATSACWSVKGKQLVVGLSGGGIAQMTPEGEIKATLSPATGLASIGGSWEVRDLQWLENHLFLVTYSRPAPSEGEPEHEDEIFALTRNAATGSVEEVRFETDPCPAFGMMGRRGRRWVGRLKGWEPFKHLVILANAPSSDVGVLSQSSSSSYPPSAPTWATLSLPETSRPTLPAAEDGSDVCPLALELDLSNSETGKPGVLVLTSQGVAAYWTVNNDKTDAKYDGMVMSRDILSTSSSSETAGSAAPASAPPAATSGFGAFSASCSSPSFGSTSSPFATPATALPFSTSTASAAPAFGSTSAFGVAAASKPAFGTTSSFGSAGTGGGGFASFGASTSAEASKSPFAAATAANSTPSSGGGFGAFSAPPASSSTTTPSTGSAFASFGGGGSSSSASPFSSFAAPKTAAGGGSVFGSGATFGSSAPPVFGSSSSTSTPAGGFSAFGQGGTASGGFGSFSSSGPAKSTTVGASATPSAFSSSTSTAAKPAFSFAPSSSARGDIDSDDEPEEAEMGEEGGPRADEPPDLEPTKTNLDLGESMREAAAAAAAKRADQAQEAQKKDAGGAFGMGSLGFGGVGGEKKEESKAGGLGSSIFGSLPPAPSSSTSPSPFSTSASPSPFSTAGSTSAKPAFGFGSASPAATSPSPFGASASTGFSFGQKLASPAPPHAEKKEEEKTTEDASVQETGRADFSLTSSRCDIPRTDVASVDVATETKDDKAPSSEEQKPTSTTSAFSFGGTASPAAFPKPAFGATTAFGSPSAFGSSTPGGFGGFSSSPSTTTTGGAFGGFASSGSGFAGFAAPKRGADTAATPVNSAFGAGGTASPAAGTPKDEKPAFSFAPAPSEKADNEKKPAPFSFASKAGDEPKPPTFSFSPSPSTTADKPVTPEPSSPAAPRPETDQPGKRGDAEVASSPVPSSPVPTPATAEKEEKSKTKSLFGFASSPPAEKNAELFGGLHARLNEGDDGEEEGNEAEEDEAEEEGEEDGEGEYEEDEYGEEEEEEEYEHAGTDKAEEDEEGEEGEEQEDQEEQEADKPTAPSTAPSLLSRLSPAPPSPSPSASKPSAFSFAPSPSPLPTSSPTPAAEAPKSPFSFAPTPSVSSTPFSTKPAAAPSGFLGFASPSNAPKAPAPLISAPSLFGSAPAPAEIKTTAPFSIAPAAPISAKREGDEQKPVAPSPFPFAPVKKEETEPKKEPEISKVEEKKPTLSPFSFSSAPAASPASAAAAAPKPSFSLGGPVTAAPAPASAAPSVKPAGGFSFGAPPTAPSPLPSSAVPVTAAKSIPPAPPQAPVSAAPEPTPPPSRPTITLSSTPAPKIGSKLVAAGGAVPPQVNETGMAGEFLKAYLGVQKDFEILRDNATVIKSFLSDLSQPAQPSLKEGGVPIDYDDSHWSFGDLDKLQHATKAAKPGVEALQAAAMVQKRRVAELQSLLLKAETKREEAARFLRAKNDPSFGKMVRVRQLGPEQAENQRRIRLQIEAVRTKLEQLEQHMASIKTKVHDEKLGKSSFKAPTLDSVNRAVRNITVAASEKASELNDLSSRLELLRIRPASTSTPRKGGLPRSSSMQTLDKSLSGSPVLRHPFAKASPNKSSSNSNAAAMAQAALGAERSAATIKNALLAIRGSVTQINSIKGASSGVAGVQVAFAKGPVLAAQLPPPRKFVPPPPPRPISPPPLLAAVARPSPALPCLASPSTSSIAAPPPVIASPSPAFIAAPSPAAITQAPAVSAPTSATPTPLVAPSSISFSASPAMVSAPPPLFPSLNLKAAPTISFAAPTNPPSSTSPGSAANVSPASRGSGAARQGNSRTHSGAVQLKSGSSPQATVTSSFDWGPLPAVAQTPSKASGPSGFVSFSSPLSSSTSPAATAKPTAPPPMTSSGVSFGAPPAAAPPPASKPAEPFSFSSPSTTPAKPAGAFSFASSSTPAGSTTPAGTPSKPPTFSFGSPAPPSSAPASPSPSPSLFGSTTPSKPPSFSFGGFSAPPAPSAGRSPLASATTAEDSEDSNEASDDGEWNEDQYSDEEGLETISEGAESEAD